MRPEPTPGQPWKPGEAAKGDMMNRKQFEAEAQEIIDNSIHQYPAEVAGVLGTQYTDGDSAVYTTNGRASGAESIVHIVPGGTEVIRCDN